MDFRFSEEQELLRATARDFLAANAPMKVVREAIDDERGFRPSLWKEIASLGWTGLIFPEEYGGAGLGYTELLPLLEEMGRTLAPLPLLPSLMAGAAILETGSEAQRREWIGRIAAGSAVAAPAFEEEAGGGEREDTRLRARRVAGGFELSGRKHFVPDAQLADVFVVSARTGSAGEAAGGRPGRSEGGAPAGSQAAGSGGSGDERDDEVGLLLVPRDTPGLELVPVRGIDPLRRRAELWLDGVRLPEDALLGGELDARPGLRRALDRALVMLACEMAGGAEKCLEDAAGYAGERVQFGRPIGANQAVKHKCADMLFAVESAKALLHHAAWAAAGDEAEAPLTAAMAKARASDVYPAVAAESIQIHGGVGFTWEYDCHLYYKRAKTDELWLGDARHHRRRIARMLDL